MIVNLLVIIFITVISFVWQSDNQPILYEKVETSHENCSTSPCPVEAICYSYYNSFEAFYCQCRCGYAGLTNADEQYKCSQRIPPESTITVEIEWVFPIREQMLNVPFTCTYFIAELINEFLWRTMYYWDGHIHRNDYGTRYGYV